jgi:hypothetical protein
LLFGGKLKNLDLPPGLTSLTSLNLANNQLTNLTLPPDMMQLTGITLDGNPFSTFALSEPLAATNLAATVSALQSQGVNVFTYPLAVHLLQPQQLTGTFQFGITGPPGVYTILASGNFANWTEVGSATNRLGIISFTDINPTNAPKRFYRARSP